MKRVWVGGLGGFGLEQKTREGGNFSSDRCGGKHSRKNEFVAWFSTFSPPFLCYFSMALNFVFLYPLNPYRPFYTPFLPGFS